MARRWFLGLLLTLVLTLASGAIARTQQPVEVLWGGSWWAAEVLEIRGKQTKIHYTGWGAEWDEWVGPERLRKAPPRRPLAAAAVGQKVEVEWHGSWWAAEVVAEKNGFFKIHYTGWGSEWDEWIEPDRMRAANAR